MFLPAVAVILAAAGALSSNSANATLAIQDVTTQSSNPCTKVGTCDTSFTSESCQNGANTRRIRESADLCSTLVGAGRFQ